MREIDVKNFHERELHPFLNLFLRGHMNVAAKTIFQEKSSNSTKGENEWIHPDMVGFNLLTSHWDEKVIHMCNHFHLPKMVLYSFELKKEITMSNLRESFFQAVSNSSWANEGYLAAAKIDTDDEKLMNKMSRLSSSFGIGIIHINIFDPINSRILFESKRKEQIDGETMNHLFEINQDFKEFVKCIENSEKINRIVDDYLDEVKPKESLEEILQGFFDEVTVEDQTVTSSVRHNGGQISMDWESSMTGRKPERVQIFNETLTISTWKEFYISVCKALVFHDKHAFMNRAMLLKGKKNSYFSREENELRTPYFLEEVGLYMELNLNANLILKLTKELMENTGVSQRDVLVFLTEE